MPPRCTASVAAEPLPRSRTGQMGLPGQRFCHTLLEDGHAPGALSPPADTIELFVPLTPAINFKARRSHYGWLA